MVRSAGAEGMRFPPSRTVLRRLPIKGPDPCADIGSLRTISRHRPMVLMLGEVALVPHVSFLEARYSPPSLDK